MADVHNKQTRSYNMSRIRSKNTKPEILVRKFLHAYGFRFRLHSKRLPGKPDIYLKKYNTVIFINGCFWHGHKSCKYFILPKTRREWWTNKISGNRANDKKKLKTLTDSGINVITVWECELKKEKIDKTLVRLASHIKLANIR
jgi:DNA mismatch endonuclease (patch repair protein)